jgi:DNA-binding PadR family transcriptional regulator
MTGYQVKQLFESSINHFWNAHVSQIYRELTRMEQDGWVTHYIEPQEGKPDKKIYSITPSGTEAFTRWLKDFPQELEKVERNEFLVRIFFASRLGKADLAYELRRYVRTQQEQLENYKKIGECVQDEEKHGQKDAFFWHMTLRRGIKATEAAIEWAEECLQLLEKREE